MDVQPLLVMHRSRCRDGPILGVCVRVCELCFITVKNQHSIVALTQNNIPMLQNTHVLGVNIHPAADITTS